MTGQSSSGFVPGPITKVEDTGISILWLQDLALKILYFGGYLSGFKIAEEIALPFAGVVDAIMESLKRDKLVEVRSSQAGGLGDGGVVELGQAEGVVDGAFDCLAQGGG